MGHDAFLKEAEQLRAILAILSPGDAPLTDRPKFTTRAVRAGPRIR